MALIGTTFLVLSAFFAAWFVVGSLIHAALWLWNDFADFVESKFAEDAGYREPHGDVPHLPSFKHNGEFQG